MCIAHLSGSAMMDVTLEIYEEDRGAWVKSELARAATSQMSRKRISGCTEPDEWLDAYPDDGWMSGLESETVPSGPLGTGTYTTGNLILTVF
jgi:hypothetical protein